MLKSKVKAGAREVAIFGAASEAFSKYVFLARALPRMCFITHNSRKNINCTIDESLDRFQDVMDASKRDGVRVRGCVRVLLSLYDSLLYVFHVLMLFPSYLFISETFPHLKSIHVI
jgi:hypothetical protein